MRVSYFLMGDSLKLGEDFESRVRDTEVTMSFFFVWEYILQVETFMVNAVVLTSFSIAT